MGEAVISECGKYRYVLKRSIPSILRWRRPVLFIMLNPSTADATTNDRTIEKCIKFAKREGGTQLTVINLFSYRSTDPDELLSVADPYGIDHEMHFRNELELHRNSPIICAWGNHPAVKRAKRDPQVLLHGDEFELSCLVKNKDGSPRHPLYIPDNQPLLRFP